ncbi:MAG: hypothetical protein H7A12_04425 [Pseudomonadales bacterium]|jgi:hypothetical protein|nr:hypothetical protein [Pseudomonadales bacterium]MCP5320057.1 hypothetical protein [Pseudomonadales bacterium]
MTQQTAFFTFTPTVAERDEAGLPRRFEGVAYSGGVIPQYGAHGDVAVDLASLQLPNAPIFALVDHDPGKRAGKLGARLAGNQVLVSGEFFTASDAGKEVAALFAEGAPWQLSIGIQAAVESGERRSVTLNGRALSVDTIFRNAKLREVSFVPVGADPETSVHAFRAARAQARNPFASMPTDSLLELTGFVVANGYSVDRERLIAMARAQDFSTRNGVSFDLALQIFTQEDNQP